MANPELDREQIRRRGLLEFVRRGWHMVESCQFVEEPHIGLVCRHLEACAYYATASLQRDEQPWMSTKTSMHALTGETEPLAGISDLVIAIPPGMSKSVTAMVFFPAWVWSWCPQAKLITTSYSEGLATRDAKRAFELMTSEWYQQRWPHVQIDGGERASMQYYVNSSKGSRYSVQMGGGVTGRHAHILVADDPIKPQDIQLGGDSAREALEKTREKWDNVFSSRSADPATFCRIVIAQRLHMEDLSGHCIKRGAVHLRLPMLFEAHDSYESEWGSDWRRADGELLAPKRFPDHVVDMRRTITDARDWAAQYQQRPSPEDGSIFERSWFEHRYRELPKNLQLTLSIDSSLKESKRADYTVLQVWGKLNASSYYLVDQVRARMGFSDQVIAAIAMRSKWPTLKNTLIEAKANGVAIINTLRQRVPGVVPVEPLDGKEARARASTWLWRAGNVHLPHKDIASWVDEFIEEHVVFPVGGHDDCVDCGSQYLNFASARDRASLFGQAMTNARKGYSFR